jgi:predicted dehydrogenase
MTRDQGPRTESRVLRVGVIGLGRRWRRRYEPALRALRERFRVCAVYDQVQVRAQREARKLGCGAAAGPTGLIEIADPDVLLLADPQWFGLWPVDLACRLKEPVFCGTVPEGDESQIARTCQLVKESGTPVMVAMAPRLAPVTARLKELLETQLGPPRLVVCEAVVPERTAKGHWGTKRRAMIPAELLDWCAGFMGSEPVSVLAAEVGAARLASLLLEFPGGRAAQISRRSVPGARPSVRLHAVAARGAATAELSGRVRWVGPDGRHVHVLPRQRPIGQVLLESFHRAVTEGGPPDPDLDDARRVLGWLRAAAVSREEGQRVPIS